MKVSYLRNDLTLRGYLLLPNKYHQQFSLFVSWLFVIRVEEKIYVIFVVLNENKINLCNCINIFHIPYYLNCNRNFIRIYFVHLCW